MRRFAFNKLVRDDILSQMTTRGDEVTYQVLKDKDYTRALIGKLREEAEELREARPPQLLEELADIQEIVDCLLIASGNNGLDLREAQLAKNHKNGSFKQGYYIESVTVDDNNPYLKHYLANPSRYPEITKENS